ncbi:MAG: endonuclease/exonuclease/phosphatase family protein [Patescibacteria group bacterium]|jgi:endonuclease/exonuclease/phosphatase family metal-dependent hydrolase
MKIRVLQWNIGGGRIREENADSSVYASYTTVDLSYISSVIKKYNVDIVTFQESHKMGGYDQLQILSSMTKLHYVRHDAYGESHIDPQMMLSQGVISRFPIIDHSFTLFKNPHLSFKMSGKTWITHDKGVTKVTIDILKKRKVLIETVHLIPFRKLGIDPFGQDAAKLREDFYEKIHESAPHFLLTGDFNIDSDSLEQFAPLLSKQGIFEVPLTTSTTPRGRKYDHVLYRGMEYINSEILSDALTDHYPVFAEFELE